MENKNKQANAADEQARKDAERQSNANDRSQGAKDTDAKVSEPVAPRGDEGDRRAEAYHPGLTDQEVKELTPAPVGGVMGSNFSGGTDGKEESPLVGRDDHRGNSAYGKEQARKVGMPQTKEGK